jgi:hypothetical protein
LNARPEQEETGIFLEVFPIQLSASDGSGCMVYLSLYHVKFLDQITLKM